MTEAEIDHEVLLLATDLANLIIEDDEGGNDMAARGRAVGRWLRELVLRGIRSPRSSDPRYRLSPDFLLLAQLGTGHALDAIGVLKEVGILRRPGEPDADYRLRLLAKLSA